MIIMFILINRPVEVNIFIAASSSPLLPKAARRAAASLKRAAHTSLTHPGNDKRLEGRQDRELFVRFGQRSYVVRCHLDGDEIVIQKSWAGLEDR